MFRHGEMFRMTRRGIMRGENPEKGSCDSRYEKGGFPAVLGINRKKGHSAI